MIQCEYAQKLPSDTFEAFGAALADMLLEENFFKKVYPILLENGFQPPKKRPFKGCFLSALISSILATIMDAKKRKGDVS